ncbi:transposase, partial [Escherichia coli]
MLQWLLFLSAVPPVQLLTGWCVTVQALPDIRAISALTAVK